MNTKRIFNFIFILAVYAIVVSCGGKKESDDAAHEHETEAAAGNEWKEMDDFHVIMAETFHPFKDSANLEPVKMHAEHLAMEAEKWSGTTLPEKVDNDEVKAKLQQLKNDTRALADTIKDGAADEAIGSQLTAVHDLFHEIQESWYGGDHH